MSKKKKKLKKGSGGINVITKYMNLLNKVSVLQNKKVYKRRPKHGRRDDD